MLMIVPLMIWSARIEIDSQAWRSETSIPVAIAATTPTGSGMVSPKNGDGSIGPIAWATSAATRKAGECRAQHHPLDADVHDA